MLIESTDRRRGTVLAIVLIGIAVIRIASTYTIFSATYDEPTHVSAGLELLTQHCYKLQYENPPLPRLVFAVLARLGGMTFDPHIGRDEQIREVFYANDKYKTNLVMARVGNLVFFIIAATAVWLWARRELGSAGGVIATLVLTMQPVILGYSGLATHDTAAAAGVTVAIVAFLRWLGRPEPTRAIVFGAAYGVAILCKLSSIGYVPAACLAIYVLRVIRDAGTRRAWRRIAPSVLVAAATCALVIWAGYAFTVGRLHDLEPYRDVLQHHPAVGRIVANRPQWFLPAPAFFLGIGALMRLNESPWSSYLFGEVRTDGWWYYFPVALALKTTLASLILAIGAVFARRARVAGEALAAAGMILLVAMPSRLDIGVRHVLPIYAPLSVAAAACALTMLRSRRNGLRVAAIVLLACHCTVSLAAHPDEFPYFNALAGQEPSRYLQDSNVDWGQDALRLRRVVGEKKIDRIGLAILAVHDYDKLGFPPHYEAQPDVPSDGWVAVSETSISIFGGYRWLWGRHYERVGKSIRLYFIAHDRTSLEETILLPVAGSTAPRGAPDGVWWNVTQTVRNDGDRPAHLHAGGCSSPPCEIDLASHQSLPLAANGPFLLITAEAKDASHLAFSTVAERTGPDGRKDSMAFPAIRQAEFRRGTATFAEVPFRQGTRINLRAWTFRATVPALLVRVVGPDGRTLAEKPYRISDDAYSVSPDLRTDFPNVHGKATVILIAGSCRVWGLVSVTDPKIPLPAQLYPR